MIARVVLPRFKAISCDIEYDRQTPRPVSDDSRCRRGSRFETVEVDVADMSMLNFCRIQNAEFLLTLKAWQKWQLDAAAAHIAKPSKLELILGSIFFTLDDHVL